MGFKELEIKTEYRSLIDDVVESFYTPILKESVLYRRAVGFFSSSALLELTNGILGLLKNDGRIELIASPRLTKEDIEAIENGFERREEIIEGALLRDLFEANGAFEETRLNLLSNLIATKRLELKIAFLESNNSIGMFHEKLGLMYDKDGNIIAFTGSMNETANAISINYESIDVYTSWSNDEHRVYNKQSAFDAMWNDYEPNLVVKSFPNINKKIIERYKVSDIKDYNNYHFSDNKATEDDKMDFPHVPNNVIIRPYQKDAILEWEKRNFVGIFDMATGTGKTYTALAAVSHLYKANNNRLAIVIVCPYQHLVEQWKDDIIAFGMKPIICYSASKQKNWEERLKTSVEAFNLKVLNHFCVITTNATFSKLKFQNIINKIKNDAVIVADEAHNFGAKKLSLSLPVNFNYRLALSATIERHGDIEGTKRIFDYFGEKCIEYTLKKAIENGMLTRYYYYPVVVSLNETELEEYIEKTEKFVNSISKRPEDERMNLTQYEKMLLIARARIVAGAYDKIDKLKEVIEPYKNDDNILVYCGATAYEDDKITKEEHQELKQIEKVVEVLGNDLNMKVHPFTSNESSEQREELKKGFQAADGLQALVAIRCLDEGVNIPSIKTAFILASSTNPKEYVQRRGRVLRTFEGKNEAVIYDFITLPISFDKINMYSSDVVNTVSGLALREVNRMIEFSSISENPSVADKLIQEIKEIYNISDMYQGDFDYEYDA